MKKIFQYTIKASLLIAIFSFANSYSLQASAWGPERATFTMESPATYPTFNSITDNPTIGDERDFVRVGEINADVTELKNEIAITPGKQYLVYVYFHNNASSTFNDSAHNHSGVAINTRMSTYFPTMITAGQKVTIGATISAENSNPLSVWDEAYITTDAEKILLHYVAGSAKIYNDWRANGSVMPSSLFSESGTLLGLNELNGVIPGCEEYHGVVTYVLQAEALGGSIDKTVSKDGINYFESVNATPGERIYFRIAIQNTGDMALTNATVRDNLPAGLTIVPGSIELSANNSTERSQLPDGLTDTGYNLGTVGTGNTVYIYFQAQAGDGFDCDGSELTNTATLVYDSDVSSGDTKQDTASVNVKQADCSDPEPPLIPDDFTDPDEPGMPQEIVNTGPLEIIMAVIILLGIGFGVFYLIRTRKTLSAVQKEVADPTTDSDEQPESPDRPE